jgi:alkylation response protein AidB-like acyl-CoA dehydrogenase
LDLSFTKVQQEWREEVRDFLDQELPEKWERSTEYCEDDDFWDFALAFTRKVSAKGWIGLTWPKEYGGLARPIVDKLIFAEELTYRGAPLVNTIGYNLAAGALLFGGTEEQKAKFLPAIAATEYLWAEGYSEPDAGSDLASLKTTAVRDGDHWVVNGQKTYTTWGSHADVLYLAARTDPEGSRHRGITIFCLDLDQPGVSFGPQHNIGGGRQNHTFLDDVRVGNDMMIGHEGRAWDLIMGGFYGGNIGAGFMTAQRRLDKLIAHCKTARRGGKLLIDDPQVRDDLVEIDLAVQAERLLTYESLSNTQAKRPPVFGGSTSQVVLKEAMPRVAELINRICGPLGQLSADSEWAPLPADPSGGPEAWFRQSFGNHGNGTSQVKRMVLATRGLGLPR